MLHILVMWLVCGFGKAFSDVKFACKIVSFFVKIISAAYN